MIDVRAVFQSVLRVWHLSLVLFVFAAILLWQTVGLEDVASAAQWGGILTSGIVTGIGLLALFAWQTAFDLFHRVFFTAGSWLFSYSDTLIRLFPIKFWFDSAVTISLLSLAGGLLLAFVGWRGKRFLVR
jgi:integral membrane protein (TIGR01906 family)